MNTLLINCDGIFSNYRLEKLIFIAFFTMGRKISILEFKRLLCDIRDRRPDVRVRVRLLGKMWFERFCAVDFLNENQVVLFDHTDDEYHYIKNVNDVVQFELECPFFGYHAFYHYDLSGPLDTTSVEASMQINNENLPGTQSAQ